MSDLGNPCECGCGGCANPGRRFIKYHNSEARRAGHDVEDRGYETPCWIWRGKVNDKGYGRCAVGATHSDYYRRYVGPVPEGMEIDHLCRVRVCVNPDHLEPVTHAENVRRSYAAMPQKAVSRIAVAIRQGRLALGMTQKQLAQGMGVTQSLVTQWETGRVPVPARRVEALEAALGVHLRSQGRV